MFLCNYKATSPARRWTMVLKGFLLKPKTLNKFKPKFLGNYGEPKKNKRSRRVGPSLTQLPTDYTPYSENFTVIHSLRKHSTKPTLLALLVDACGTQYYQRAHCGAYIGEPVLNRDVRFTRLTRCTLGTYQPLCQFTTGSLVFSISTGVTKSPSLANAAGTYCKVLWHQLRGSWSLLRIPSKNLLYVNLLSLAISGRSASAIHYKLVRGCAKKTLRGFKKVRMVRGVAKNPVDHPNGGRANTKQPLKNPWGKIAKKGK